MRSVLRRHLREGLGGLSPQDRLSIAWMVACGPVLADRGTVIDYREGMVRIEVCDAAWLEQMQMMRDQLKEDLARIAGVGIAEIHFVLKVKGGS
jgi:hypothetical protein